MSDTPAQVDLLFLVDATASTKCTIKCIRAQCADTTVDLREKYRNIDPRFAVVAYRDPIDHEGDQHESLDFTESREILQSFLANVKSYGGRDDAEDLAGGIELALGLSWRPSAKKCVFLVTDANAHGSRFSGLSPDPHEEQGERLVDLVRQMAQRRIYLHGINIKKGRDPGAQRTFEQILEIYEEERGPKPVVHEFTPTMVWQVDTGLDYEELRRRALEQLEVPGEDEVGGEDVEVPVDEGMGGGTVDILEEDELWSSESLNILRGTLYAQLNGSFRSDLGAQGGE
jgi:hypothetical protein